MKTVTINVEGASQSQWSTFLLELNLMKKAWKRYGVKATLKAPSINKSFLIILKSLLDQNLVVKSSNHHIDLNLELFLMDHTFLQL